MCTNCPWELPLWKTSINDITGPAAAVLISEVSMNPVEYSGFIFHTWDMFLGVKGKGMVLYSAVSSPLDRSKRFTLSSPDRPVHSSTHSASLGSILAMQQLRNDYSLTCPPLSIARYSFCIQLTRLRRRETNENAQTSKR